MLESQHLLCHLVQNALLLRGGREARWDPYAIVDSAVRLCARASAQRTMNGGAAGQGRGCTRGIRATSNTGPGHLPPRRVACESGRQRQLTIYRNYIVRSISGTGSTSGAQL